MGLLDYIQDDPTKQEALRQGLLNAGIQMLAGGRQDLGVALGQGMGAGVPAYQQQLKQLQARQAQQSAIDAAMGKRPPVPMGAQPGMGPRMPQAGSPMPQAPNSPMLSMDYSGKPAAPGAPMGAPAQAMPQPQPMQEQPQQMDMRAYMNLAAQNPDNPDREIALQALSKQQGADASPFGKIMPGDYTPESLAEYDRTRDWNVLKPVGGGANVGKYHPRDYTPESWTAFATGGFGDPSVLRQRGTPMKIGTGSAELVVDPVTGEVIQSFAKNLAPGELPSVKAEQVRAAETAKAEVEAITTARKDAPANANAMATLDRLDADIQAVIEHPGLKYAVGAASMLPIIAGTPQADAFASVQNLADRAAVAAIQDMRNASKTGGAVGAVSEKEWPKLEAQKANLMRAQSYGQFVTELKKFQNQVRESKRLIEAAQRAGGQASQPRAAPSKPPKFGEVRNGYRFIGGVNADPRDKNNWQKVAK